MKVGTAYERIFCRNLYLYHIYSENYSSRRHPTTMPNEEELLDAAIVVHQEALPGLHTLNAIYKVLSAKDLKEI